MPHRDVGKQHEVLVKYFNILRKKDSLDADLKSVGVFAEMKENVL